MSSDRLQDDLLILEINDVPLKDLNIQLVKTAFYKRALVRHPDKGGSKEGFQELQDSYQNILQYLLEHLDNENLNSDEHFLKDLFEKFNFPQENNQSFTIRVENELADIWEETLSVLYSDPTRLVSNGRQWKTSFSFNDCSARIFVTLWNKPKTDNQSKILI